MHALQSSGGWVPTRHDEPYSTNDFEVSEASELREWASTRVHAELLPTMKDLFFPPAALDGKHRPYS